ncbi:hypothetical protein ACSNOI_08800 [Actinomadura kijaniata]|uniref:hypothetical protein n=1 Tax=Actinomadura kijaniata TaxID=46161 RepID=UPI003F1C27C9
MSEGFDAGPFCEQAAIGVYNAAVRLAGALREHAGQLSLDQLELVLEHLSDAIDGGLLQVTRAINRDVERRRQAAIGSEVSNRLDTATVHLAYGHDSLETAVHLLNLTRAELPSD